MNVSCLWSPVFTRCVSAYTWCFLLYPLDAFCFPIIAELVEIDISDVLMSECAQELAENLPPPGKLPKEEL